ncbi:MAG: hypothetical protein AAGF57_01470 [Pseudomonadota bacterium]
MSGLQAIIRRYRVAEDPLHTLRKLELVAVVLALLLCLQIAYSAARLMIGDGPTSVAPAADSMQVPGVVGPSMVEMEGRRSMLERPLFWLGRRPSSLSESEAEPVGEVGQLEGVKLVGVFGSGDRAGVILLDKSSQRRLLIGERFNEWELNAIDDEGIHFMSGERQLTLRLERSVVKASAKPARSSNKPIGREIKPYTQLEEDALAETRRRAASQRVKSINAKEENKRIGGLGLGSG